MDNEDDRGKMPDLATVAASGPPPAGGSDMALEDSGERQEFASGSRRDINNGKPRPDLISPFFIMRLGRIMGLGAVKYGDHNWSKGQPNSRFRESIGRHLMEFDMGLENEDHLLQLVFNVQGIVHNQEMKKLGWLPDELDDYPVDYRAQMNGGDPNHAAPPNPSPEAIAAAAREATVYMQHLIDMLREQCLEGDPDGE